MQGTTFPGEKAYHGLYHYLLSSSSDFSFSGEKWGK